MSPGFPRSWTNFRCAVLAFEKRNFKQALKDAKVAYRLSPAPEARALLECAYAARSRELHRNGLSQQAREALEELLLLGITQPEVQQEVIELSLLVGLKKGLQAGGEISPEMRVRVQNSVADRAVTNGLPDSVEPADRPAAQAVCQALRYLEQGDEQQAAGAIKDIPRGSPFADWKLFVRGLIAYYRHERVEMAANWDRLDANRAAARIAAPLKALDLVAARPDNQPLPAAFDRLERGVFATSLLSTLPDLERCMSDDDRTGFVHRLKRCCAGAGWGKLPYALCERLTSLCVDWAISCEDEDLLTNLESWLVPQSLDPRWHRAHAVLHETASGDPHEIELRWAAFVDALPEAQGVSDQDRTILRALVWQHQAQSLVLDVNARVDDSDDDPSGPEWQEERKLAPMLREMAIEYFNRSIAALPTHAAIYRDLAKAFTHWNKFAEAAQVWQRMLEHFPNDVEALSSVASYYLLDGDDPIRSLEPALKVLHLRPLDETLRQNAWFTHLAAARKYSQIGNWDRGRDMFSAAAALESRPERALWRVARQAIFELAAGQKQKDCLPRAEELVEQSLQMRPEPTAALLILSAEASRYGLPKKVRDRFVPLWNEAIKRPGDSSTAGALCELLCSYLESGVEYTGHKKHANDVANYIRRAQRITYTQRDLEQVCRFLQVAKKTPLARTLIKKGSLRFPDCAYFQFQMGEAEFDRGPMSCNRRRAIGYFQRVLALTEKLDDSSSKRLADLSRQRLTTLRETHPFPLGGFGSGRTNSEGSGSGRKKKSGSQSIFEQMADMLDGIDPSILEDIFGIPLGEAGPSGSDPSGGKSKGKFKPK